MSANNDNKKSHSGSAKILGSASSAILELAIFHPVDTISKRLMSNQTKITSVDQFKKVVASKSLYAGLNFNIYYKLFQRVYKYSGQSFVKEWIDRNTSIQSRSIKNALAGSMIGIGEIALLPLDVLKIKMQTNPDAFKGKGVFNVIKEHGIRSLYSGAGWTAARNAPGSFALFGANSFAQEYILKIKDNETPTWGQNFFTSIFGASASLIVSAPLDVIKTRIQNKNFGSSESGFNIVKQTLKNEGITAFFKGLTPKLLTTGPKLVFSFALAQSFIPMFDKLLSKKD
ncbi:probable Mitochondrial GTP/GDP carrier protein 1 [Hanseniaspora guilliermondii]|uniref:Probable Mitochondrial GTP/GDP carrier protein 1 n=1 Tax=Hanseniaspora guilliermondii TaxID=56406 RepID=A0A1L0CR62_9ASCO|nr:probable Mitochondrial GTP/GDP carrier protein 1 [Hanseniaspora guilliermondii]